MDIYTLHAELSLSLFKKKRKFHFREGRIDEKKGEISLTSPDDKRYLLYSLLMVQLMGGVASCHSKLRGRILYVHPSGIILTNFIYSFISSIIFSIEKDWIHLFLDILFYILSIIYCDSFFF